MSADEDRQFPTKRNDTSLAQQRNV